VARRRVLPPGELRCICAAMECYRRRHTTTTKDDRRQWPSLVCPLYTTTLCRQASNNSPNSVWTTFFAVVMATVKTLPKSNPTGINWVLPPQLLIYCWCAWSHVTLRNDVTHDACWQQRDYHRHHHHHHHVLFHVLFKLAMNLLWWGRTTLLSCTLWWWQLVGQILVGFSADEPDYGFSAAARDTMCTITGVDVRSVVFRGKFVFVTQIGSPQTTRSTHMSWSVD